jgi:hypothetical protein
MGNECARDMFGILFSLGSVPGRCLVSLVGEKIEWGIFGRSAGREKHRLKRGPGGSWLVGMKSRAAQGGSPYPFVKVPVYRPCRFSIPPLARFDGIAEGTRYSCE